jgi:DNA-directed RNA polymerase I and III subunit RPAC2
MDEPTTLNVDAGADPSSATFTLYHEDHTVGNTLRYMLNKKAEVSFVGYSVPHPAEAKMNLRLQTVGPPATEVLLDALSTVHQVGEHVLSTFDAAIAKHRKTHG